MTPSADPPKNEPEERGTGIPRGPGACMSAGWRRLRTRYDAGTRRRGVGAAAARRLARLDALSQADREKSRRWRAEPAATDGQVRRPLRRDG
jgi:hypothetical protein